MNIKKEAKEWGSGLAVAIPFFGWPIIALEGFRFGILLGIIWFIFMSPFAMLSLAGGFKLAEKLLENESIQKTI